MDTDNKKSKTTRLEGDAGPSGSGTPQPKPTSEASLGSRRVSESTLKRRQRKQRAKARRKLESLSIQEPASPAVSVEPTKVTKPTESSTRKRSLGSTPGSTQKPPQKVRKVSGPGVSGSKVSGTTFSEKAKKSLTLTVGSLPGEPPLTMEEFLYAKRFLHKRVLERSRTNPEWPLHVESCTHHNGKARLLCGDERSLEWVKGEAKKLVPGPVPRKGYWVMGPGDLPPFRRCTAFVPFDLAENKKDLLQLLSTANTGLRIAGLHITTESAPSGQGHTRGRVCVFAVEDDVLQQLNAVQMRPWCGLGRLLFRLRDSVAETAPQPHASPCDGGVRALDQEVPEPQPSATGGVEMAGDPAPSCDVPAAPAVDGAAGGSSGPNITGTGPGVSDPEADPQKLH